MSMSPDDLHFRVYNTHTGVTKYYNGLFMPNNLNPSDHIEFMSSLVDKYGEAIYDGDIVIVTDNDILYKAIVTVDFKHGTLLKPIEGASLRPFSHQYFGIQEKQLEVIDHAEPKEIQNG